MIEIPESHTLSRQLNETVKGKIIRQVIAGHTPHGFAWYHGDPAGYDSLLSGLAITDIHPCAGYVVIAAGDRVLLLSEGVNLRFLGPGEQPPKKHQLYICFMDDSALVAATAMYGLYFAGQADEFEDNIYYKAARQAPSPLTDAFTEAHFAALLTDASRKLSAKAFLATEQRIPGLGNGCLQDILFAAGIHPKRKMHTLPDGAYERLFHTVRNKLAEMTLLGGRSTEKGLFGTPGGYRVQLGKDTVGTPCPVCGSLIVKQAFMGGSIYFCPRCQPL